MPTKTRLDPTAGGVSPPAELDGAQGSGRGDNSASARSGPAVSADVAGFMDSLSALAAHLNEREAFEEAARRGWAQMAALSGLVVALAASVGVFVAGVGGVLFGSLTFAALYVSALATAAIAVALFALAAAGVWRVAPDSVDRVALRHEDSPLRDRIRITQWLLFDSVLERFAYNERRVNATIAQAVLVVSLDATLSLALVPVLIPALRGSPDPVASALNVSLIVFLILTLGSILLASRSAKAAFRLAQHYGRQVLAFDEDFGGFLPRAEKEHVELVVNRGGGADGQGSA